MGSMSQRSPLRDVLAGDVAPFNETLRERGVPAAVVR